jgi:hypothetical protein
MAPPRVRHRSASPRLSLCARASSRRGDDRGSRACHIAADGSSLVLPADDCVCHRLPRSAAEAEPNNSACGCANSGHRARLISGRPCRPAAQLGARPASVSPTNLRPAHVNDSSGWRTSPARFMSTAAEVAAGEPCSCERNVRARYGVAARWLGGDARGRLRGDESRGRSYERVGGPAPKRRRDDKVAEQNMARPFDAVKARQRVAQRPPTPSASPWNFRRR